MPITNKEVLASDESRPRTSSGTAGKASEKVREFVVRSLRPSENPEPKLEGFPVSGSGLSRMWKEAVTHAVRQYAAGLGREDAGLWMFRFFWIENGKADIQFVLQMIRPNEDLPEGTLANAHMSWGNRGEEKVLVWWIDFDPSLEEADFFAVLVHEIDHIAYYCRLYAQFGDGMLNWHGDLNKFKAEFFSRTHVSGFMMDHQELLGLDLEKIFGWAGSGHNPEKSLYDRSASLASRMASVQESLRKTIGKKFRSRDEGQFHFEQITNGMENFLFSVYHSDPVEAIETMEAFMEFAERAIKKQNLRQILLALSDPKLPGKFSANSYFQAFQYRMANLSSSL